jgi:ribosomal protein L11 methylase PrmA
MNNMFALNLTIIDNSEELVKAEETIKNIQTELLLCAERKSIDDHKHENLYENTIRVLSLVGQLSKSIFNLEDSIEAAYTQHYIHSPALAKKLWYEYYESLHHPYTILKNRCWRMLDEIDSVYVKKFHKKPLNWDNRLYDEL